MAAALLAAILFLPVSAQGISARNAILLDGNTGRVLFEKRADAHGLIASTTKIMTALIVCEQCNVLDRMRIPKEAVGIEGSSMYLKEGEVLTLQELLYGMMLSSGNDAAVALAIYCGGTVEGFAQLMNDKARSLGLANTHFVNPNGLDAPGHYSTARDMAVLAAYAMENPIFAQTVSTKQVRVSGRHLTNHNKLLWRLEGADGVKTGYTRAAGRILVSSAKRQGRRLVAVTMDAPNDWSDHMALMDHGFAGYSVKQVVSRGTVLGRIPVFSGRKEWVELCAASDVSCALSEDEQIEIVLQEPGFVYAPVSEGQYAGKAYFCVKGAVLCETELYYASSVEELTEPELGFWQRLKEGIKDKWKEFKK